MQKLNDIVIFFLIILVLKCTQILRITCKKLLQIFCMKSRLQNFLLENLKLVIISCLLNNRKRYFDPINDYLMHVAFFEIHILLNLR